MTKKKEDIKLISQFEYKKLFLPNISEQILENKSIIQLYRLEAYLRNILIPVVPYRTDFNFILFVNKGYIKQYLENEEFLIQEQELFYIKQGSITATLEISDDIEGYFLMFENNFFTKQNASIKESNLFFMSPYFNSKNLGFNSFIKLLNLMEYELLISQYGINDIILSMLQTILLKMNNLDGEGDKMISRALEVSFNFRNLLYEHHKTEKKVIFYADKLCLTENYLNKCLKEITGKTPKQWINEADINYSEVLLQSGKSISDIAYELNFQTPSHFSQVFKRIRGISPTEYKENYNL